MACDAMCGAGTSVWCYAMCGTDLACTYRSMELVYAYVLRKLQYWHSVWYYAMPGADLAYGSQGQPPA
eukprot:3929328-Rhodomonas_salina.1